MSRSSVLPHKIIKPATLASAAIYSEFFVGESNRRESLRLNLSMGLKVVAIEAPLSVSALHTCLGIPAISRLNAELEPLNLELNRRISDLKNEEPRLADISQRLSEKIDTLVACLATNAGFEQLPIMPVSLSVDGICWSSPERYDEHQWLAVVLNPTDMVAVTNARVNKRSESTLSPERHVARFQHPAATVDRQISRWVMKNTLK